MSNSIGWRPSPPPESFVRVMTTTSTIVKRLFGEGWALSQRVTVDHGWDPYFRGLKDAGYIGAREILDAIEEHGSIELELGE